MTDKREDEERTDRNRERSEEAHWRVAEAGAEEEERSAEGAPRSDEQNDWDDGGALDRDPNQTTEASLPRRRGKSAR